MYCQKAVCHGKRVLWLLALSLNFACGLASGQTPDPAKPESSGDHSSNWTSGLRRTDLVAHDLSDHQQVVQVQVDFGVGVASPKHSHPGVEIAHVLKGTFDYILDGKPPVSLKAGESLYIPPGVPHVAINTGPDIGSELATYIVEKNVPIVKLEK